MRDYLCDEKDLNETLNYNLNYLSEDEEEIEQLYEDLKNGINKYTIPTEQVIFNTKTGIFLLIRELIWTSYSLGMPCEELEELFSKGVKYIDSIGYNKIGYVWMVSFVSLGILLETSRENMQILINKMDEEKADDLLLDYLVNSYGMERKIQSFGYEKEIPYKYILDTAIVAQTDRNKASEMLKEYTEKKWLKGHSDYGWTTAHKEPGYYGLWSFESGAVAKICNLDDEQIKTSNRYPYDLVHYKNESELNNALINEEQRLTENANEEYKEGIVLNQSLQQIIPPKYQSIVNDIIFDYENISDRDFWNKYKLNQVWYDLEDFQKERKKGILGTIIVFVLVDMGYVLQVDYKEETEEYKDKIKNYWDTQNVRLARFDTGNDQEYYAWIPSDNCLEKMYEVKIVNVGKE